MEGRQFKISPQQLTDQSQRYTALTFLEAATIVNQLTDGKSTHAKLLADENKIPA